MNVQNPRVEFIRKFQDAAIRSEDPASLWSYIWCSLCLLTANYKATTNILFPFELLLMQSSSITLTTSQQKLGLLFYTLQNDTIKQLFGRDQKKLQEIYEAPCSGRPIGPPSKVVEISLWDQ